MTLLTTIEIGTTWDEKKQKHLPYSARSATVNTSLQILYEEDVRRPALSPVLPR